LSWAKPIFIPRKAEYSRWKRGQRLFRVARESRLRRDNRVMLIGPVQGVVCAFNEHSSPFNQRGGEERTKCADENPLKKSGVHRVKSSTPGASPMPDWSCSSTALDRAFNSPKAPLAGVHDPQAQQQIRDRMS
jgi:hypothetical protein